MTTKKTASAEGRKEANFEVVDEMPRFNGGTTAMMQYLSQNVHYPLVAQECHVQGRVIVAFIVKSDATHC